MSEERFGMPDHAPRHDQPLQSTTAQGSWANIGGGDGGGASWGTPQGGNGYVGGGGGYVSSANVPLDPIKKIPFVVLLAVLFGPLGLFYVRFLYGVIALFTVIPAARAIGLPLAFALGIDPIYTVVPVMWCITVPWAIAATVARNRKFKKQV